MREITPIERMLALIEKFEHELELMKAEVAAYLPEDGHPVQDWITDPLTGERRYIKRKKL
ncbi:hypothetical protein [Desulfosarcina variabilis]|uniref:hypothetical protein n=1 Tax=Desulfosarcina variabilis TaxID=2300 RepID=UPI003AFB43C2